MRRPRPITMDELVAVLPETPCLFTADVAEALELCPDANDIEPATLGRTACLLRRAQHRGLVRVVYSNPNGPMWGRA